MTKTKIKWCDYTWNPVWGCENDCEYCYARKIAKRFYKEILQKEYNYHFLDNPTRVWTGNYLSGLKSFKPTWLESNYVKKLPRKPSRIFVNSMSDWIYWKKEWLEKVLEKIKGYPEHIFLFLTKFPENYHKYQWPNNCWLGFTATNDLTLSGGQNILKEIENKRFVSIEPILAAITVKVEGLDWIIIGAETGNRKGRLVPKKRWFEELLENGIPVFMKENLKQVWEDDLVQEFPEKEEGCQAKK